MISTPQVKRYPAFCRCGVMVATPVLGTGAEMREGSSPFIGTMHL
jgi:hypothetical protein